MKTNMKACCGIDCSKCPDKNKCGGGCNKCNGHPFGGNCVVYNTISKKGKEGLEKLKKNLIDEINNLDLKGLKVDDLNYLRGAYVNLEYKLPNGEKVKFLNDNDIYFGNQICTSDKKCYGVICNEKILLVCTYGENGKNPKLVLYKNR